MKHMKKSMFLSTILMVVLLVVALSTATFAWFTSNNTVTATETKLTAGTTSDANIGIGWAPGEAGSTVYFKDISGVMPMIPAINPMIKTDLGNARAAVYMTTTTDSAVTGIVTGHFKTSESGVFEVTTPLDRLKIIHLTSGEITKISGKDAMNVSPYNITNDGLLYDKIYATKAYALVAENPNITDVSGPQTVEVEDKTYAAMDISKELVATGSTPTANQILWSEAATLMSGVTVDSVGKYLVTYYKFETVAKDAPLPASAIALTPAHFTTGAYTGKYSNVAVAAGKLNVGDISEANAVVKANLSQASTAYKASIAYLYCVQETKAVSASEATTYGDFSLFQQGTGADNQFSGNGQAATKHNIIKKDDGTNKISTFYVSNNGENATGAVTMNIEVTGDNSAHFRLAVFVDTKYVGTLAQGESQTFCGKIFNTAHSEYSLDSYQSSTSLTLGTIAKGGSLAIQLVAWFDGVALTGKDAGKDANFGLTFTAAKT